MAIGTVTWGNVVAGNGAASLDVPYPASPEVGDLLVVFAYSRANVATAFAQPNGWGTVKAVTATANGSYAVYYKVSAGTESGNLSLTANTSNNTELARMCKIPGGGTTFDAGAQETEVNGTTYSNAGVTAAVAGSLIVLFVGKNDGGNGTTSDFSSWTGNSLSWSGVANGSTGGTDGAFGIGTAVKAGTGATGAIQCTAEDLATEVGISYSFAIRPGPLVKVLGETVTLSDESAGERIAGAATVAGDLGTESVTVSTALAWQRTATPALDYVSAISDGSFSIRGFEAVSDLAESLTLSDETRGEIDEESAEVIGELGPETVTATVGQASSLAATARLGETATVTMGQGSALAATARYGETVTATDVVTRSGTTQGEYGESASPVDDYAGEKQAIGGSEVAGAYDEGSAVAVDARASLKAVAYQSESVTVAVDAPKASLSAAANGGVASTAPGFDLVSSAKLAARYGETATATESGRGSVLPAPTGVLGETATVSVGQAGALTGGVTETPNLNSVVPSSLTAGATFTVNGRAESPATVEASLSEILPVSEGARVRAVVNAALGETVTLSVDEVAAEYEAFQTETVTTDVAMACSQVYATSLEEAVILGEALAHGGGTPTPLLLSVVPDTLTAGATFTINGLAWGVSSQDETVQPRDSLAASLSLIASFNETLTATDGYRSPAENILPTLLEAWETSATTGEVQGDNLLLRTGQYGDYAVNAGGGAFWVMDAFMTSAEGAKVELLIDGVQAAVFTLPSSEEEEEGGP